MDPKGVKRSHTRDIQNQSKRERERERERERVEINEVKREII